VGLQSQQDFVAAQDKPPRRESPTANCAPVPTLQRCCAGVHENNWIAVADGTEEKEEMQ
jgi:hypothetical protein